MRAVPYLAPFCTAFSTILPCV